jgi:hypothetical protein
MNDAWTQQFGSCFACFGHVMDTRKYASSCWLHAQKVCIIIRHKFFMFGQHQDDQTPLGWAIGQLGKKEVDSTLGSCMQ